MKRVWFLVAAGIVGLVGLRACLMSPMPTDPEDPLADCAQQGTSGTGGGGGWQTKSETWSVPLEESLKIFEGNRTAADDVPMDDCNVIFALDLARDPELPDPPGLPKVKESRLALAAVGIPPRNIYLIPTRTGLLCSIVTGPAGHYGCGARNPTYGFYDPAESKPFVYGGIPNDVTSVLVITPQQRVRARLGENVFFTQLAPGTEQFDIRFLVTYRGGRVERH